MGLNLAAPLSQTADRHPDAIALRRSDAPGDALSYRELDVQVAGFAGHLRELGVGTGDRVALMAPNLPGFVVAYWATLRIGAVAVPMNPLLKSREIAYYLEDSGARAFVHFDGFAAEASAGATQAGVATVIPFGGGSAPFPAGSRPVASWTPRGADDAAVLLYTSGTTGTPKGAVLTHSNMTWNAHIGAIDLLDARPDDVVIGTLPLFHSFGQSVAMNATVATGGTLVLVPRFDPVEVADTIAELRATIFLGVPTMYGALLQALGDRDVGSLRRCLAGGAAMPVELLSAARERLACPVLEGYGLSETSPVASFNRPDDWRAGSIGKPIRGVEMRVVDDARRPVATGDVGEIQIRGHCVMAGYHGRPDATAAVLDDHGWLSTGDLARTDEDGFIHVVDRSKDLILRGGMNVYPREVEEILYEHPAVSEAAVVGVPHDALGEEVAAVVALRPGTTADGEELRVFVRDRIAAYKYPRVVAIVDALPKGPTGKILKREIDLDVLAPTPPAR
ncbi:MAG: long-chain fatty acid--CoA ligase [Solirubrobacteraceae bacterium]